MCGIVGIIGKQGVAARLVEALRRLEYRGYDSAGVAIVSKSQIERRRASGKLSNLVDRLAQQPLDGTSGIGHTRWATHGKPTENNAHPHATPEVAVVHNGIIENFRALKESLQKEGVNFESDTDTEIVVHLITRALRRGMEPQKAVADILPKLHGAFALVFLFRDYPDVMIGARRGSPLAIGYGDGEMFFGSDAIALAPMTQKICYLEEGDWAVLGQGGAQIFDEKGLRVERAVSIISGASATIEKGKHRHFMAKEIHEQPEVVGHTLAHAIDMATESARISDALSIAAMKAERIIITACGTAYYAGFTAKYWIERFARIPVDVEIASEVRYREPPISQNTLMIVVSQSGETADTLAAMRYGQENGAMVVAVVNVPTSTIARLADIVLPTLAGPEIGVASTKAFTCQLAVLASLAIAMGRVRGQLSVEDERKHLHALIEAPGLMAKALQLEPQIITLAKELAKAKDVLYLGRGTSYPLALEGALKLKEISYIHAEGYAAGELKHGPIALIDELMPVIVIAPSDHSFEKTASNMHEVAARGGRIVLLTDAAGAKISEESTIATFVLPDMPALITPLVYSIPMQLLAYHTAVFMGTDVDQPRNLAKSVTVE